jgi:hypothetical protein
MKRVVLLLAAMAAGSRVPLAEVKIGTDGHDVIKAQAAKTSSTVGTVGT